MKWSNILLYTTMSIGLASIVGSNLVMKQEFDNLDKSDPYWNYKKISDQEFHHLVVQGGNISNIVYEQSSHQGVKVMKSWWGAKDGSITTKVINDTLYLNFSNTYKDVYEKYWLRDAIPVRLFSPGLFSVTGNDTKLSIEKFDHPDLAIDLHGNSKMVVKANRSHFDQVNIALSDSSILVLIKSDEIKGSDEINIKKVIGSGKGTSLINLRTSRIDSLNLNLTESSSAALSAYTLQKWNK